MTRKGGTIPRHRNGKHVAAKDMATQRPRERFDRKSLKEDAIQDTLFWLIDWAHKRLMWIVSLATAIVVIAGGGYGYLLYQDSLQLSQAEAYYQFLRQAAQPELSTQERKTKEKEAYESFLQGHPGSNLAPVAWLNLARLAWERGDLEEARRTFQLAAAHNHSSAAQQDIARLGLARIEEAQGNIDASEAHLRSLSDQPYDELKAYQLGRLASARNQNEEARRQFQKVSQGEPGSALAEWARQQLDYRP